MGIRIGYWDFGLGLGIGIGDLDAGLDFWLGLGIGDWGLGLRACPSYEKSVGLVGGMKSFTPGAIGLSKMC